MAIVQPSMHAAKCSLSFLVFLLIWGALFVPPATAKTILFHDDFSAGLDKWQQVRPQATAWQVVNESAQITISQNYSVSELVPRSDLWDSDWQTIRFELDFTPLRGTDRNLSFHFQDLNNWYELHFTAQTLDILHLKQSTVVWSSARSLRLQNGQTYHIELRLHEQHITLLINGQLIAQEFDPTFADDYGRIGLKAGTGADAPTEIKIDNVLVSEYSAADLGVTPLTQTDPTWASDEYDAASRWADETGIDAWGCALTSMTMIFHYYGISRMPDGTPLTPQSFNSWLKTQPDGYIGEGLVNWQAGLRLARSSHEQYGTPLLAYSKVIDDWQTALQNELKALRPAIIQLPGHFVVAEGIASAAPLDFAISDPAFSYTRVSQHTELPVSVRTFVPVSVTKPTISVLSNPSTTISLSTENSVSTTSVELLRHGTATNAASRLTEILHSAAAQYRITVASPVFQISSFQMYLYNSLFQHVLHTVEPIAGPNGLRYSMTGDSEGNFSPPKLESSYAELLADVPLLHQQELLSTNTARQLDEVFFTASHQTDTNRYQRLSAELYIPASSGLAQAYITQQLAAIE